MNYKNRQFQKFNYSNSESSYKVFLLLSWEDIKIYKRLAYKTDNDWMSKLKKVYGNNPPLLPPFPFSEKYFSNAIACLRKIKKKLSFSNDTEALNYILTHAKYEENLFLLYNNIIEIERNYFKQHFRNLIRYAKGSSINRTNKGRKEAGTHTLTEPQLLELYIKQEKKCFFSGITFNVDIKSNDWILSCDRIDNTKGYIIDNIRLVVRELNIGCNKFWSPSKIKSIIKLREELINLSKFNEKLDNLLINKNKKIKIDPEERCSLFKICTYCFISKLKMDFPYKSTHCIECINSNINHNTKEFICRLLTSCKTNSNSRKFRVNRKDNSVEFTLTIDDIICKLKEQRGRCYYSNIPLVLHQSTDWQMSIERLDNSKGYNTDNIVIICLEFNNSAQWSKVKFDFFLSNVIQINRIDTPMDLVTNILL
jgi:hypothetical protein